MVPGTSVLIEQKAVEVLSTWRLVDASRVPLDTLTVRVLIRRLSDDYAYDHDDATFKSGGHVKLLGDCRHWYPASGVVSGVYSYTWDLSDITNRVDNDTYQVFFDVVESACVNGLSMAGELRTWDLHMAQVARSVCGVALPATYDADTLGGRVGNFLNAAVGSRAVPGDMMALTPTEESNVATAVLAKAVAGYPDGSLANAVEICRKLLRNKKAIVGQNLVVYEANGVTPYLTLPLKDVSGGTVAPGVGEPAQIG